MKKIKILKQKFLYSSNETPPKVKEIIYDCIDYNIDRTLIDVTIDNIDILIQNGFNYNIGDIFIAPLDYVTITKENEIVKEYVLGDKFYKLYEFIDGEWKLIDEYRH